MKQVCFLFFVFYIVLCYSCNQKNKVDFDPGDLEILHSNEKLLTEIIIHDIFNPPVASRIYAYTSLAQYEAIRFASNGNPSIAEQLNGFPPLPMPEKNSKYNYILAATKAFCKVASKVRVFDNKGALKKYEDSLFALYKNALPKEVFEQSIAFGDSIANQILKRAAMDNYKQTRGMAKYLGTKDDGRWQPTGPDYLDGSEPYWCIIKPFALDTCSQFRPMPPPAFSRDTTSSFYKLIKEVQVIGRNLTNEQKEIARYWDDNPFVMEHAGHMMFGNKKITPGGHWMGITAIACRNSNADAVKTAHAYALTSIALLDAFISCWDAKYNYHYVRPITVINSWIDKSFEPFLQTPPFPEYTSGHSTISGSASTVLTHLFGDNFSFLDDSDKEYIGMTRQFSSFRQAAEEASISRVYGGIHIRASTDSGLVCGRKVGRFLLEKTQVSSKQ